MIYMQDNFGTIPDHIYKQQVSSQLLQQSLAQSSSNPSIILTGKNPTLKQQQDRMAGAGRDL